MKFSQRKGLVFFFEIPGKGDGILRPLPCRCLYRLEWGELMRNILNDPKAMHEVKEMLQSWPWGYAYHRILLDHQGRPEDYEFLHVNKAFEDLTGLKREDVVGHRVTRVLPGMKTFEFDWIAFYGRIALEGGHDVFEQYSEALGKWYQVQVFSSEKGYFTTLFVDITPEKQRAEDLESFFEVNPDLLCIANTEGFFLKTNRAWEEVLGYDFRTLEGRKFLDLVHPEDMEKTLRAMSLLESQEKVLNFVNRYRCKDGSYRFIEWRSSPKGKLIYAAARDITERRENEERLRASEENFRTFFETMVDMITIGDEEGTILYSNPEVTRKLEYSPEELRGMHLPELHPEEHREDWAKVFREMSQKKWERCSLPLQTKKGISIPVETRIWFGFWNGQKVLFRISKDLSKEQEALQKFNKLFESNPSLMAVTRISDLQIVDVNHAFLETLGYAREEIIGKTSLELDLFADMEKRKEILRALQNSEILRNVDLRLRTKSGEIREGLFSGEIIESQGERYLLAVMTDITERKRAEGEVALRAKMQEMLTHTAKACINMPLERMEEVVEYFLGEIGRFIGARRAYVFHYCWDRQVYSNSYEWCEEGLVPQKKNLQDIALQRIADWTERHRRGETIYIPDLLVLPKERHLRKILEPQGIKSLMAVPMMESGECVGFVEFDSVKEHALSLEREKALLEIFAEIMVNLDIRKNLEKKLVEEKEKAQAASRAKSEFLANMSHEIRTPLNGVIGFTELLQNTPLSFIQEQYVANANASGRTLLQILNDVLDFSKIEAGKLELETVETDLLDLLRQSVNVVAYGAEEKGLKVRLHLGVGVPRYIMTDPVRLKQVLGNLLSNAVKFTEKGEVVLGVRFFPLRDFRGHFHFSVRDTGIGIGEEERKKLFKAFSQGDSSTTRKYGGTGLGLAISSELVRRMGGSMGLKSVLGEGSTFFFSFQASWKEEGREKREVPAPAYFQEPSREKGTPFPWKDCTLTVGVAEDNAINMKLATTLIGKLLPSARIVTAKNGREALEMAEREHPHLLFMDVQMPEMDGNEATRAIREREKGTPRHLAIVGLTAGALKSERDASLEAGMDAFLLKPLETEKLREILHAYLFVSPGKKEEFPGASPEHFDAPLLQKELGDFQALQVLVKTSRRAFPRRLALLEKALEERDRKSLLEEARAIKRTAEQMHFGEMENAAASLERLCTEEIPNFGEAALKMDSLIREWTFLDNLLETMES